LPGSPSSPRCSANSISTKRLRVSVGWVWAICRQICSAVRLSPGEPAVAKARSKRTWAGAEAGEILSQRPQSGAVVIAAAEDQQANAGEAHINAVAEFLDGFIENFEAILEAAWRASSSARAVQTAGSLPAARA